MSTHTPGPWLYRDKSDHVYTAPPAGSGFLFGEMIFRFDVDASPSNADLRLILAAPKMLAALKAVVRVADRATAEFDLAREAIGDAE